MWAHPSGVSSNWMHSKCAANERGKKSNDNTVLFSNFDLHNSIVNQHLCLWNFICLSPSLSVRLTLYWYMFLVRPNPSIPRFSWCPALITWLILFHLIDAWIRSFPTWHSILGNALLPLWCVQYLLWFQFATINHTMPELCRCLLLLFGICNAKWLRAAL